MDASTAMELIWGLLGGLALFIFGMRTMSEGLSVAPHFYRLKQGCPSHRRSIAPVVEY